MPQIPPKPITPPAGGFQIVINDVGNDFWQVEITDNKDHWINLGLFPVRTGVGPWKPGDDS